jgi:hypothetical protein
MAEQDDRVAYLYLSATDDIDFGVKSCWVRNLKPAPEELDVNGMKQGTAPMMPRASCAHSEGAAPLEASDLELVWLEEGDSVALLERGEIITIVPGWSGFKGFKGYARDCTEQSRLAWPLTKENVLRQRVRAAQEYWRAWHAEDWPWPAIQDAFMTTYHKRFGNHEKYYAIDGNKWPPKALIRIPVEGATVLVTAGVSIRPQPQVEPADNGPPPYRRIELGMAVSDVPEDALGELMNFMSAAARYPWRHITWFGHGHTISCDAVPPGPGGHEFPAILLLSSGLGREKLELPEVHGEPVDMLWIVPITQKERALAQEKGSKALVERLEAAGCSWVFRPRDEIGF